MSSTRRVPISARHAYALAFDLAVRRDPVHSLLAPLLMRAPWIVALAMLPPLDETRRPLTVGLLTIGALLGDFAVLLAVGAMLRFRARSVFNTAPAVAPAPVLECYALGLRRMPWLLVTEVVRNSVLAFAFSFAVAPAALGFREDAPPDLLRALGLLLASCLFVLPTVFLGFRLSFATEAIVLRARHMAGAFAESFRITDGRFERWIELIAMSVGLAFAAVLVSVVLTLAVPALTFAIGVVIARVLVTAVTPVFQYAWTFFYLRLIEGETPGIEVGPAYAAGEAPDTGSVVPPAPSDPSTALFSAARTVAIGCVAPHHGDSPPDRAPVAIAGV